GVITASEHEVSGTECELSVRGEHETAAKSDDEDGAATQPYGLGTSLTKKSKQRDPKLQKQQKRKQPERPSPRLNLDDEESIKDSDESSDDERWNDRRTFRPGYIPKGGSSKRLRKAKEV